MAYNITLVPGVQVMHAPLLASELQKKKMDTSGWTVEETQIQTIYFLILQCHMKLHAYDYVTEYPYF